MTKAMLKPILEEQMSALKDCELSINRQYGERDVVRIEAKSDGRRIAVIEVPLADFGRLLLGELLTTAKAVGFE